MSIRSHIHPKTGLKGFRVDISRQIKGVLERRTQVVYGTKEQAKRVEARLRSKLIDEFQIGEKPAGKAPTFGSIVEDFLTWARMAKRDFKHDEYRSKRLLSFFGAETAATDVRHQDVTRFVTERRKTAAVGTVNRDLALMKAIYREANRNQAFNEPCDPARWVKMTRETARRTRTISDADFHKVLEEALPVHRAVLLFARYTGLRRSHLLSLTWEQLGGDIVTPQESKGFLETTKRFGQPPIPAGLITILGRKKKRGFCFTWGGKPMTSMKTAVENIAKRAGVEFGFHDLRRSYAVHLRKLGVSPEVRRRIMGHAAPRVDAVQDRYQPVSESEILKVGKQIGRDKNYKASLVFAHPLHTKK